MRYGTQRFVRYLAEVMDYWSACARYPARSSRWYRLLRGLRDGDGIADDAEGGDAPFWVRMQVENAATVYSSISPAPIPRSRAQ